MHNIKFSFYINSKVNIIEGREKIEILMSNNKRKY